jgi:hypothetical protein
MSKSARRGVSGEYIDAVEGLRQRPAQQPDGLVEVVPADELRGVLAVVPAALEPRAGARDAVHERLHRVGAAVDDVLAHDQYAGHEVGPVLAGVEEHPAEAAHFRLRGV